MTENERQPKPPECGEQLSELQPRIWVGSLSDYNEGVLHGEWLDAWQEPEELEAAVAAMLARSPSGRAEEWGIFDSDDFSFLDIGEHESLATVSALAGGLRLHGPAFAGWAAICDREPDWLNQFDEAFLGHFESLDAYAEQLLDDLGYTAEVERAVPSHLRPYVSLDVAGFARDVQLGGDVVVCQADAAGSGSTTPGSEPGLPKPRRGPAAVCRDRDTT